MWYETVDDFNTRVAQQSTLPSALKQKDGKDTAKDGKEDCAALPYGYDGYALQ